MQYTYTLSSGLSSHNISPCLLASIPRKSGIFTSGLILEAIIQKNKKEWDFHSKLNASEVMSFINFFLGISHFRSHLPLS